MHPTKSPHLLILVIYFLASMVWSTNGHISAFQVLLFVALFPRLLHLFDYIWFCDLRAFYAIQNGHDWFNDHLVCDIGAILFHVWAIRSHARLAEGAAMLLPKHSHVIWLQNYRPIGRHWCWLELAYRFPHRFHLWQPIDCVDIWYFNRELSSAVPDHALHWKRDAGWLWCGKTMVLHIYEGFLAKYQPKLWTIWRPSQCERANEFVTFKFEPLELRKWTDE